MNLIVRPRADRFWSPTAQLLAAAGYAFILGLSGCSRSSGTTAVQASEPSTSWGPAAAVPPPEGSRNTLMQMNLRLSGLASCYCKVPYPALVAEAVDQVHQRAPGRGHLQEACGNDIRADRPLDSAMAGLEGADF